MKSQKSQQKLTLKIQKIKELIRHLENFEQAENNQEAGIISQLLKMMISLFEEVNQKLTELDNKLSN